MESGNGNPNQRRFQTGVVDSRSVEIKPFKPRNLSDSDPADYGTVKKRFGTLANTDAGGSNHFNLHPAAKKLLGVEKEERSHIEGMVQAEVEARLEELREEAFQKGLEAGRAEGKTLAEQEHRAIMEPMEERFSGLIAEFDALKKELYSANESFLISLVFQVGKQVLLRELQTDRDYVKRLTAHVVEKVGAKDHVRIRVGRQDAEMMEQIKEHLKLQLPDLKNVQIEASDDLPLGGCKVETDLSRMNASVETQMAAIEKALGEA
jgi:flagellar biosynthesis/type III secretory pathway protein FliH